LNKWEWYRNTAYNNFVSLKVYKGANGPHFYIARVFGPNIFIEESGLETEELARKAAEGLGEFVLNREKTLDETN
jgi:hypothetical protein